MRRLAIIAAIGALATAARADEHAAPAPTAIAPRAKPAREPRAVLTSAFADQRGALDRARASVDDKVATARAERAARVRAAYRALRPDAAATTDRALEVARRRAAVRWILARDRGELALLVDEAKRLTAAAARIDADADRARTVELPAGLAWPVRGEIIRRFGVYEHDRSRAILTRRGLDVVVDATARVGAPARGVVRYAGAIRGLDHGVVIDHGGYLSVIGKLGPPAVAAGDAVEAGALLGRPAKRRVYVEVRAKVGPGGTPIDPESVLPAMQHAR